MFSLGREILTACLGHLSNRLTRWSVLQEDCSTAVLIARQPKGKRTCPGLLARLLRKRTKPSAVKALLEDGLKVASHTCSLEGTMIGTKVCRQTLPTHAGVMCQRISCR